MSVYCCCFFNELSLSLTIEVPEGLEPPNSVTVITHVAWRSTNNCQLETSLPYFSAFFFSSPISLLLVQVFLRRAKIRLWSSLILHSVGLFVLLYFILRVSPLSTRESEWILCWWSFLSVIVSLSRMTFTDLYIAVFLSTCIDRPICHRDLS